MLENDCWYKVDDFHTIKNVFDVNEVDEDEDDDDDDFVNKNVVYFLREMLKEMIL